MQNEDEDELAEYGLDKYDEEDIGKTFDQILLSPLNQSEERTFIRTYIQGILAFFVFETL